MSARYPADGQSLHSLFLILSKIQRGRWPIRVVEKRIGSEREEESIRLLDFRRRTISFVPWHNREYKAFRNHCCSNDSQSSNTMLPPPHLNIEFMLDICWAADVDDGGHGLSGGVTQSKSFSLMQAPIRGDRWMNVWGRRGGNRDANLATRQNFVWRLLL